MTLPSVSLLDASFVVAVTGAAMAWPPLALGVAALYFLGAAVLAYRNAKPGGES